MWSDICNSWPRGRRVSDLGRNFHLENFWSLNPQRPQQSLQLLRTGRNFRYMRLSEPRRTYSVIPEALCDLILWAGFEIKWNMCESVQTVQRYCGRRDNTHPAAHLFFRVATRHRVLVCQVTSFRRLSSPRTRVYICNVRIKYGSVRPKIQARDLLTIGEGVRHPNRPCGTSFQK